ncbi:uncharacterized protein DUF3618 [Stackebrandtia endophytica]|uniref:Uncharacterized protein DUF3618 n=1 Tax=Stackebrandtia endophytica TaxID=1496996 RepID=A0A543AQC3_9ACTN|nr:DUF3618 domain-containing protein [Stackebrandtia endophytica]TQL74768.1 uncharacterized protein DUF3618 [Stackebrandtia endophytica]
MTLERDRMTERAQETEARIVESTPASPLTDSVEEGLEADSVRSTSSRRQQDWAELDTDSSDPIPKDPAAPIPEDPAALRADILATRSALGATIEQLADRVSPLARGRRAAARVRAAGGRAGDMASRHRRPLLAAAIAVAVAGVAAVVIRNLRIHHPRD